MHATIPTEELWKMVGGLSEPSKMPCYGYSLPARACKVGSVLRDVEGSTCSKCYAYKGNYSFPAPQKAMQRRLEAITRPEWVAELVELIRRKVGSGFFRWHDSGDIQSPEHMERIAEIAKKLPKIRFWLPTRETQIVREYLSKHGKFPKNLTVRVSAGMMGAFAPKIPGTVGSGVDNPAVFQCPAKNQGNNCWDCRACWDFKVKEVSYPKH